MNNCTWEHDEICTNDQSPMVADYCPVQNDPGVCRHESRTEEKKERIVYCKECIHYKPGKHFPDINFCHRLPYYAEGGGLNTSDDDFCSRGERR